MKEEIKNFKGRVVRCTYNSADYKVFALEVDKDKYPSIKKSKYGTVTIFGDIHELGNGQMYEVSAIEQTNKYGYGYKISNIRPDKPMSEEDMYVFLQEILTLQQASQLYLHYPNIVDLVVNGETDKIDLSLLKGIKEKTFEKIKTKIIENYALCDLVTKYNGVFSISMLKKIHEVCPSVKQIEYKLQTEPYTTLTSISRVGFITADAMLLKLEKNGKIKFDFELKSSKERCMACMVYQLEKNEESGHTKTDLKVLREEIKKLVPSCIQHYVECLKSEQFHYDKETFEVSLKSTWETECYIAEQMIKGLNFNHKWDIDWSQYQSKGSFPLTDEQLKALEFICKENIVIVNGFAGSGKSATTGMIIQMLDDNQLSYKLFAPTGRSAKILAEYTNRTASTIHRGLGYKPPNIWESNVNNKLECDVLIIDEFSMTDIWLFKRVIDAIDFEKTKLLLIGDSAQLPSVGAGNLLHDFLESKCIPTVSLTQIFRYGEGGLMTVATDTRNGKPYLKNITEKMTSFGNNKDFSFIQMDNSNIVKGTVKLYQTLLAKGYKPNDIQILTAKNVGNSGAVEVNKNIQKVANKNYGSSIYMNVGETNYYKGDMVIQTVNNYHAKLYADCDLDFEQDDFSILSKETFIANGETGTIIDISPQYAVIDFAGTKVEYDKSMMNTLKHGYCISIHKSQGGSAKIAIVLTPSSHAFMLDSNLIYVALTRTKEKCYQLGDINTINSSVKKKTNLTRKTYMKNELIKKHLSNNH